MNERPCSHCGARLSATALGGLCPNCLAGTAQAFATGRARDSIRYFGNYELIQEIARGGMGVVYAARQISLNRIVAVKMILSGALAHASDVGRFRAEAEAAANLHHPNIVAIYEIGEHDGQHYFSMEYIEGQTLSQLAAEHPLEPRLAAEYVKRIAGAVQYAHQQGTFHRDLKPSNVIIDEGGEPRVTDFGLAKRAGGSSHELTLSGQVLGTPGFLSPEQAAGSRNPTGAATDVYGLGAILYYLLAARPPFAAGSLEETLRQAISAEPAPLHVLNPGTPRDLETICLKCLEKEPRRRYASAREVADELERFLRGEPIQARPANALEKGWRWCRRHPTVASLSALVVVLVLAVTFTSVRAALRISAAHDSERNQRRLAEERLDLIELQRIEEWFSTDQSTRALAGLAELLRQNPSNHLAAARLMFALAHRDVTVPVGVALSRELPIETARFSSDARYVVTVAGNVARVWNLETGLPITPLLSHDEPLRDAHFSSDGERLLTIATNSVRVWNVRTATPLLTVKPSGAIRRARLSRDGNQLVVLDEQLPHSGARVWNVSTAQPLSERLDAQVQVLDADFSADGQRLVTAAYDYTAWILTPQGTPLLTNGIGHRSFVYSAHFSPDGDAVVTASADGTARVWDAGTGTALGQPLQHLGPVRSAIFSPDGQHLATVENGPNVWLWNVWNELPLAGTLRHGARVRSAEFSPEGLRLLTVADDNTVRVWETRRGELLGQVLRFEDRVLAAQFANEQVRISVQSAPNEVRICEVRPGYAAGEPLRWLAPTREAHFNADGSAVVATQKNGTMLAWDARSGGPLAAFPSGNSQSNLIPSRFSVVVAGKSVRVVDARTAHPLSGSLEHEMPVAHAELSRDGRRLLTLCRAEKNDSVVRVWELPEIPGPLSSRLPDLAENLAGRRLNKSGVLETIPASEWTELKKLSAHHWGTNNSGDLLRWFLSQRRDAQGAVWPRMTETDVRIRLRENQLSGLHEAVRWSPTNATALAALARVLLTVPSRVNPRHWQEADWFSKLAVASAPETPEIKTIREEVMDCPADMPIRSDGGGGGVIDDKLYVTTPGEGFSGGKRKNLHVYNPARNHWRSLTPSPAVHNAPATGTLDGRLYLAGGGNGSEPESGRLDVYDPKLDLWTTKAPMPTARVRAAGAVLNGKFYVAGGMVEGQPHLFLATVEAYDPAIDSWSSETTMPTPRAGAGAAVLDGTLYVVGGGRADSYLATVEAFVPGIGWTTKAPLPEPRANFFIAAFNGHVYVAGGSFAPVDQSMLFVYSAASNQWRNLAPMPASRYQGSAAGFINGRFHVVGGWTSTNPPLPHADLFIYDPKANRWSAPPEALFRR